MSFSFNQLSSIIPSTILADKTNLVSRLFSAKGFMKEELANDIAETIKLGEGMIEEELCAKGKAYRKKRMANGEKSSAYLNGRAVKVCKGQMKG